jgi:integrase
MPKALTAKAIENMKPSANRKEIPDGALPGLYLVVQPSGAMSWAVRYRFEGKPRKHTIGPCPAFSLLQAREQAGKALRAVAEGRDPAGEKAARKEAKLDLVNDVLDEFIKRHVEVKNRPSTATEAKRIIEKEIRPKWGERAITSITRAQVITLLDKIADRAPILANRVLALLRKFFSWAVERDIIPASPLAKRVNAPAAERTRERILADWEITLLWKAAGKIGWPFGHLVKLLLITGQRRNEVAEAERAEFQLTGNDRRWTIPPERAKNGQEHHVPLSSLATTLTEDAPRIGERYLLTTTGETPISGFSKAKAAIDAEMLAIARQEARERGEDPEAVRIDAWTLHDLRRTAASGMARLGFPVHVVEAVLNHRSGSIKGVARVYNRYEYYDEKKAALDAWAAHIQTLAQ